MLVGAKQKSFLLLVATGSPHGSADRHMAVFMRNVNSDSWGASMGWASDESNMTKLYTLTDFGDAVLYDMTVYINLI